MATNADEHQTTLTYLGHACIRVDIGGTAILMDPWLIGPSNGGGWWHLPALTETPESLSSIDYIMISHVHNDHFHIPSLQRLPKSATAIVPYGLDPWMADALRELKFKQVIEIEHGQTLALPSGVVVENYQHGRIDSAYWLRYGEDTILNLNDCPVSESWLEEWLDHHPRPDVALGAFSYASPYPVCYDVQGQDREGLLAENVSEVLSSFAKTMGLLKPQYAIPFATQYGFFLPGSEWMTQHIPTPQTAIETITENFPDVNGVLLNPSDRLSVKTGKMVPGPVFDWNARDREATSEIKRRRGEIERVVTDEPHPPKDLFERFATYFTRIISRNWLLRRKLPTHIAFLAEPNTDWWVIDCKARKVYSSTNEPPDASVSIRLPGSLLFAAIDGHLNWETLYLSNRLHVTLDKQELDREWQFWRMLFNFPDGIFRDRLTLLSSRGRRVLRRRYPEIIRLLRDRITQVSNRKPYGNESSTSSSERAV